ncbi:hypothetical protein [Butyrivibrio hungatei]|uniref:hypothetical protein n=1 Tax=Butyrivibrio hungatei TaxID=185008 RepID=UPI000942CDD2|nr:hypothetical protein [Butyrivibrio hungatei]
MADIFDVYYSYNSEIFCAGPAVLKQGSNSIEFFIFRCLFDSISRCEASENHDYFNLDAYRPEFWGNGASQIHELVPKDAFCVFHACRPFGFLRAFRLSKFLRAFGNGFPEAGGIKNLRIC